MGKKSKRRNNKKQEKQEKENTEFDIKHCECEKNVQELVAREHLSEEEQKKLFHMDKERYTEGTLAATFTKISRGPITGKYCRGGRGNFML